MEVRPMSDTGASASAFHERKWWPATRLTNANFFHRREENLCRLRGRQAPVASAKSQRRNAPPLRTSRLGVSNDGSGAEPEMTHVRRNGGEQIASRHCYA